MRVKLYVIVMMKENQDGTRQGPFDLGIMSNTGNCFQILPVDKYWKLD